MSWSFSTTAADRDSLAENLGAKADEYKQAQGFTDNADVDGQIGVAIGLACDLVFSGAIGYAEQVNVTLSGHANPGHVETEGYANDAISVSVATVKYRQPLEADTEDPGTAAEPQQADPESQEAEPQQQ